MSNNIMLVGRIDNVQDNCVIIKVSRNFENKDGIYESDLIPVKIFEGLKKHFNEYAKEGNIIGIKGFVKMQDNELQIIAEKVTFLSSQKSE